MDYLNPKKQARHRVILFTGYVLIAIAIVITAVVLLYQAYGYGIGKNGTVIQNGLAFFSSQPNPASIYVNGVLNPATTNTRLVLPSGIYNIRLSRAGYDDWQRSIQLDGGSVEHFDYPFLFSRSLTTTKLPTSPIYSSAPELVTQSPDRRWLIVGQPGSLVNFDIYDLKNPTTAPVTISLPDNLISKATSAETWQLAEWADDNQHVLLQHNFDGKTEFILLDRANPEQSINLNSNLSINPTNISLENKKYDQYYLYDDLTKTLQTASLSSSVKTMVMQHVLAYQSYGSDTLLYVTDDKAPAGKVLVKMLTGGQASTIHSLPASPNYVVDLTQYSGTMYVAVGASAGNEVYIYKDPLGQLAQLPNQAVVPSQVLHVEQPNYLSFSANAQFIVTEHGSYFGVYDIENQKGYSFVAANTPDPPLAHAEWMDGDRLFYVSNGKLNVFDYDHTNAHVLMAASGQFLPAFAPDYKYVYAISQNQNGQYELSQTSLLAPADR